MLALLSLHDYAVDSRSTFVTGAGFGVLATESVVLTLCEDQLPASRVRCAAIPAFEAVPGPIGNALASSITEALAFGGRQYEHGRLVRAPLLGNFEKVPLPDGRTVGTASSPTGELEAAQRASGAPFVTATTSMIPSSSIFRKGLPPLLAGMKIAPLRNFARRQIAAIEMKAPDVKIPQVSWSYARVEWLSGVVREGWLRTGDAMTFTATVMARLAVRLEANDARPGAYTPGALFGCDFAIQCGGKFVSP